MANEPTTRPWWKLGPMTWLGILLLVLVNLAVFTNLIPLNRRTLSWIVYSLDPYTWPLWISAWLWCAILWKTGDLDRCPNALRQLVKPAAILFFLGAVGFQNNWHLATQQTKIYSKVYLPYIIGPLSAFLIDGSWDWKTFILPSTALAVLSGLIVLLVKTKRMKEEEKTRKSERLRGQVVWFVALAVIVVAIVQIHTSIPPAWKADLVRNAEKIHETYIVTPMTSLMATGDWDWKTFLFPGTGLLVLAGLIYLIIRLRSRNHETKKKEKGS